VNAGATVRSKRMVAVPTRQASMLALGDSTDRA
jgi:hypothetical protein